MIGRAILEKMGWQEGRKIGKNPFGKITKFEEIELRKDQSGLGSLNENAIENSIQQNPEL